MIYLTSTARTMTGVVEQIATQRAWIRGVELRVDLLDPDERAAVRDFPALVRDRFADELRLICTVRRVCDGGAVPNDDEGRQALLRAAVDAGFHYIDVEADLPDDSEHRELLAAAERAGVTIIRSLHDFQGVPANLAETMRTLPRGPAEVAKCAVTPRSTGDLLTMLRAARALGSQPRILVGMGSYGFPTRALPAFFGNVLTFASSPGTEAAPGHVSPETLATSYRVATQTDSTRLFAVIGNPISHSRSPEYHNARFAEEAIDACYLPVLVDDVPSFFELALALPLLGFSVTIPHKRAVIEHLTEVGDDVRAARACNTVVRIPSGWHGLNTDIVGFLAPLDEVLPGGLDGVSVLVLGAGGAARGVVYGLVSRGASVVLWNRTASRAEELAADLRGLIGTSAITVLSGSRGTQLPADVPFVRVVVNTTSAGMHGEGDPAPWYAFRGTEVAYDIVYTPPETPFLVRAAEAGCRIVTGDRMFTAQAAAQYELYRTLATADPADV